MKEEYFAPALDLDAFHCPHCGVYAHQEWFEGTYSQPHNVNSSSVLENIKVSICHRCEKYSLWFGDNMIYPKSSVAPMPTGNMPADVKADYIEARNIVNASPRAASALLRLAIEKLMPHLGENDVDLNTDVGNLVKKGLPITVQKALESVMVIGNNCVQPGTIDLRDDPETANSLFSLINIVVDVMITQPKEVNEIFTKIPKGAKDRIAEREK